MSVSAPSAAPPTAATHCGLLLDTVSPSPDATRVEHRVIAGSLDDVWDAVLDADFVETVRRHRSIQVLFALRSTAERLVTLVRGAQAAPEPEVVSMRLRDMPSRGEWVRLGERPLEEIVFGAIGRFWAGETEWRTIDAEEFAACDEPGLARIAAAFSLRPYGDGAVLVSYECRTTANDPASRAAFLRYWRALSPFIGIVLRAQLHGIDVFARERARTFGRPGA
jgi:hypothetical protein